MTERRTPTIKGRRKNPGMAEKLAAALLQIGGVWIPRDLAKELTPKQIIALFECDHDPIPVVHGGGNEPANLTWRIKADHREKTAKIDIPAIAKSKRLTASQAAFRTAILAKDAPDDAKPTNAAQRSKIKASWPKGRKLQSRGFNK